MRSDGVPEMRVRNSREVRGRRGYAPWLSSTDHIVLPATSRRALTVPLCTEPRTRDCPRPSALPRDCRTRTSIRKPRFFNGCFLLYVPLHICIYTSPHLLHKSPNSVSCSIPHHRMLSIPAHVLYTQRNLSLVNRFTNAVSRPSLPYSFMCCEDGQRMHAIWYHTGTSFYNQRDDSI